MKRLVSNLWKSTRQSKVTLRFTEQEMTNLLLDAVYLVPDGVF